MDSQEIVVAINRMLLAPCSTRLTLSGKCPERVLDLLKFAWASISTIKILGSYDDTEL